MNQPFDGIAELVAVAESGGFSAAARRLGVSTSHVSRKVAALEDRLGLSLVIRTTRHVRLTEAGGRYAQRGQEMLQALDAANHEVTGREPALKGTLHITAAGEFAENYLAAALIAFAGTHPGLNFRLNYTSRYVNLIEEGFDLGIRYGPLPGADLMARKLVNRDMIAAAAPAYLAEMGEPDHPNALVDHRCLLTNSDQWRFQENGREIKVRVGGRWRSNSGRNIVAACRAGLGIAYMSKSSFGDALHDGSLVPLLRDFGAAANTTWLVYPAQKHPPARVRLAVAFLVDWFKDWHEDHGDPHRPAGRPYI
ncbi:LysR family transcriptional regulator [Acanthopleuribacter pedis]|uniref:LysR family transcriptional regulator n=1 Tax=Acanthopleuribacter pedis TaxID=442870 RepID=A0A8J7QMZ6_9BACT|nr:LysR family transcriptional regulator [Acanthopleuribacter pedis]MBO1321383.1 LysR family transcriptional regulator [Acanthopleuribacter pedis]